MEREQEDEAQALKEMLEGPWIVEDNEYEYEITLKEDNPEVIGKCIIATCNQEYEEIADLIADAPRLKKVNAQLLAACEAAHIELIHLMRQTSAVKGGSVWKANEGLKAAIAESGERTE